VTYFLKDSAAGGYVRLFAWVIFGDLGLARNVCQGRADGNDAPAINLIDGQANENVIHRDNDNDNLGFRPAVVCILWQTAISGCFNIRQHVCCCPKNAS
jgi:hypothetical protein